MMFKQAREARRARRAYELARLETLIAEFRAQSEQRARVEECPMCKALEDPEQRAICATT